MIVINKNWKELDYPIKNLVWLNGKFYPDEPNLRTWRSKTMKLSMIKKIKEEIDEYI